MHSSSCYCVAYFSRNIYSETKYKNALSDLRFVACMFLLPFAVVVVAEIAAVFVVVAALLVVAVAAAVISCNLKQCAGTIHYKPANWLLTAALVKRYSIDISMYIQYIYLVQIYIEITERIFYARMRVPVRLSRACCCLIMLSRVYCLVFFGWTGFVCCC